MRAPVLFLLAIVAIFLAGCIEQPPESPPAKEYGKVVFTVKDKAADFVNMTGLEVEISDVGVHSSEQGWIYVSNGSKRFDLLALRGRQALIALVDLEAGNYTQVRFSVRSARVWFGPDVSVPLKVPSGTLYLVGTIEVCAHETASATLDFEVNDSLHVTGSGKIIFAPVVKFETRKNVSASVVDNIFANVAGGTLVSLYEAGTDINWNFGEGRRIDKNADIEIDDEGRMRVVPPRVQPPEENETGANETRIAELSIMLVGNAFNSTLLEAYKGDYVKLTITSLEGTRSCSVEAFGARADVPKDSIATLEFLADKVGEFDYACSLPRGGMPLYIRGVLKVSERPPGEAQAVRKNIPMNASCTGFSPASIRVNRGEWITLNITGRDYLQNCKVEWYSAPITPARNRAEIVFLADRSGGFALTCNVYCWERVIQIAGSVEIS